MSDRRAVHPLKTMPDSAISTDRRKAIGGLVIDLLLPLGTYVVLRVTGVDAAAALTARTAGARLAYVTARTRRFDVFGALLMVVLELSLASAIATGDERILLARESVILGLVGAAFAVSCALRRPLGFAAAKAIAGPEQTAAWDSRWAAEARIRHAFMVITLVWSTGLLGESVVRLPLI